MCFQWLTQVAPSLFKVADQSRISKMKREERIQPLFNKFVSIPKGSTKRLIADSGFACSYVRSYRRSQTNGVSRSKSVRPEARKHSVDRIESRIIGVVHCCIHLYRAQSERNVIVQRLSNGLGRLMCRQLTPRHSVVTEEGTPIPFAHQARQREPKSTM